MKPFWLLVASLLVPSLASAQLENLLLQQPSSLGVGWSGFTDFEFLLSAFLTLLLAVILATVIAFHPKHGQTADTLEEIEAPKVYVMYSVIGAIIGIMVVQYGFVVGFTVFGIGGLIRFRTLLRSPRLTGQVILVTLIGLSCGLELPHVAVLATAFSYGLIYILDSRVVYRIDIRSVPPERIGEAADAYRTVLEQGGCRIVSEKKNPVKDRIRFIFKSSSDVSREDIAEQFAARIDPALQGTVDWEVD